MITLLFGWIDTVDAQPFEVLVHEAANTYKNTITITLRDPISDDILDTYEAVSGGFGRGSAPFGHYEIGNFRKDSWIGPRWELHQVGVDPGEDGISAYDPRIGKMRTWLQLHTMHGFDHIKGTLGCIGVYGGPDVWARFQEQINYILSLVGTIRFDLGVGQQMALDLG